jgi:phosphoribosylformylglycinamidine synthase
MTISIIRFGGSNCDRDSKQALEFLGIDAELVWYKDGLPADSTGAVLPGGFSYGDYLRAGAMAAREPIMTEINDRVTDGFPVLGVCNGAQIGCESGLVPGAFTTNKTARFRCEHVTVRVENAETRWTAAYDHGEVLTLPIAHGEGRFEISDEEIDRLEANNRILFRYCTPDGEITEESNPNGSKRNIAGLLGPTDNIAVLMPHPERVTLPDIGPTDGQGILTGFA